MRPFTIREEDGTAVVTMCDLCGDEICEGEHYYSINGETVCPHCLAEYAAQTFAPFLTRGGEGA